MVGQLVLAPKGRGKAAAGRLYGLSVLRTEVDRAGFWGEYRLDRAGRNLRRGGVLRVLVPKGFDRWPLLERFGLRPVEADSLVRAQSVPLALEALERQGLAPDRATVALRGIRADREMARTAAALCAQVRRVVVDAPNGGTELARWLRRELGVPILPPGERGQVALEFQPGGARREETLLQLYGPRPELAGLTLSAPGLAEEDREDLPLLAALWEGGKLDRNDIKIT
ncbi:MAG: hypothetical protein HFF44_10355 [Lawsonibacter sp.]|nr:hypothetical protein [Lawsonibacter sp.]